MLNIINKIFSKLSDPSTFDFSDMTSDEVAYYLGRLTGEIVYPLIGTTVLIKTGVILNHVAETHSIDTTDSEVVSDNLFKCLEYLD